MPADEDPRVARSPVAVVTNTKPASAAEASAIAAGDALFKANCVQCHAINEKVVGPALAGITKRRSISWLVPWVQNSAKVIASGDEYGVKLFNDNGKQQMPSFGLSKKEIEDIVIWIEAQQMSAPATVNVAVVTD
jgi:mono/diheme cytochrome c family protein